MLTSNLSNLSSNLNLNEPLNLRAQLSGIPFFKENILLKVENSWKYPFYIVVKESCTCKELYEIIQKHVGPKTRFCMRNYMGLPLPEGDRLEVREFGDYSLPNFSIFCDISSPSLFELEASNPNVESRIR